MILDLIVSKNMARRQLNPGQQAFMALEYKRFYEEAVRVGRPSNEDRSSEEIIPADRRELSDQELRREQRLRESSERAARTVGASGRAVQQAKAIQRDAPDLAAKVRSGEIALDRAEANPRNGGERFVQIG